MGNGKVQLQSKGEEVPFWKYSQKHDGTEWLVSYIQKACKIRLTETPKAKLFLVCLVSSEDDSKSLSSCGKSWLVLTHSVTVVQLWGWKWLPTVRPKVQEEGRKGYGQGLTSRQLGPYCHPSSSSLPPKLGFNTKTLLQSSQSFSYLKAVCTQPRCWVELSSNSKLSLPYHELYETRGTGAGICNLLMHFFLIKSSLIAVYAYSFPLICLEIHLHDQLAEKGNEVLLSYCLHS